MGLIPRTLLVTLVVAASCTGGGPPLAESPRAARPSVVRGRVQFEARLPTPRGASAELTVRPARLVEIELRGPGAEVLGRAATDLGGRFALDAPSNAVSLVVLSRIRVEGHDLAVTRDQRGRSAHELAVPLPASGEAEVEVLARDQAEGGPGGALHLLDTLLLGVTRAAEWTGRPMPPITVWWGRGVTRSWSYYRGEQPPGSGRYALELLGGQPGQQRTSDTDEHDEAIVLHELGHLLMDLVSTDSSPGGHHPPGHLVDPGLAWEEGRVTWFATAVLGDPRYWDTIGVEPEGKLRVERDLERVNAGPQGMGSEQTVAEVLWDLADGAGGIPDADDDGVALGPAALVRAMMALREVEGAFPALPSFLAWLVESGVVAETELKAMLARTGQPADLFGGEGAVGWPVDLVPPARARGRIDGLSDPAPSGGPPRPESGLDAVRAYRVRIGAPASLAIRLEIDGSGRAADHSDLDLELRTCRAELVVAARTEAAVESLEREVAPGCYVVYVRDGGLGNRVDYSLGVTADSR